MRERSGPTNSDVPPMSTDDPVPIDSPTTVDRQVRELARFYMTSDLRAATGLTRTHLDFYLREGVIVPTARTESGYLLFDDNELSVLRQVIGWRQDGVGVRDIRLRLGRAAGHDEGGGGR